MKRNLTLFILLANLCFTSGLFAQNISFTYDAAGNRTGRDIVVLKETKIADTSLFNKKALIDKVKVIISPNPNGGVFSIKLANYKNSELVTIFLHDLSGKQIFKKENCTSFTSVDISTRENGMYILSIIIGNEKKTWKVIKE